MVDPRRMENKAGVQVKNREQAIATIGGPPNAAGAEKKFQKVKITEE